MVTDCPRYAPRAEVCAARPLRADAIRFAGLWIVGSLSGLARPTVAIVGSRAPSDAARERARELGAALARAGVCVVSGLALGIDGAAHAGALVGCSPTIGVLGGGHGHFFPRRNRELAAAMVSAGGAVLSPYAPDEPARPPHFLQRNAVVAALADAVVVVEAATRSGALNTASWAAALGVDVLAFPGDVDRPKAAGANALIRDGATLVRDATDVLEAIGIAAAPSAAAPSATPHDATGAALVRSLARGPCDLDALVASTRLPTGDVLAALVRLELAGTVVRRDGTFARAEPERAP